MTNKHLRHCYATANRLYFRNKLPKDLPVRFAKTPKHVLGMTKVYKHNCAVSLEISKDLKHLESPTVIVLLHECVHVENPQWRGHGWQFEHRMLELAKAGAFAGLW